MHEQLHLGDKPQESLWNPIKNILFIKPEGGLWTSTFLPDGNSDWSRWCINNDFRNVEDTDKWILTPSSNAKLYVINSVEDLIPLCDNNTNNPYSRMMTIIDFESLMKEYDGIHLTKHGERNTRFSMPYSLYGWDCESTIWFRWMFDDVRLLTNETSGR